MKEEVLFDPAAGAWLTPSYHGERCVGNGKDPEVECCCDECDHFLECFSDWKERREK